MTVAMSTTIVKSPLPSTNLRVQGSILSGIQAVIFDKDGTLADSRNFLRQLGQLRADLSFDALEIKGIVLNQASQQELYGILGMAGKLDPDGLLATGSRHANQTATAEWMVKVGGPGDQVDQWVANIFQAADRQLPPKTGATPPFQGTADLLRRLSESSLKVGVLSSDSPAHLQDFLEFYHLTSWLDGWRGTEKEDPAKPDPALFYQLCNALQVQPQATVIVGDSWVDLRLAERAEAAAFISVSEAWGRSPVPGGRWVIQSWQDLSVVSDGL